MKKEDFNLLNLLNNRLNEEMAYKERCDRGELSEWDPDYDCYVVTNYNKTSWKSIIEKIIQLGYTSEEIEKALSEFITKNDDNSQYISEEFIEEIKLLIKRKKMEEILIRDDVVEYISSMNKEELEKNFGEDIARMKDFDQKNPHHCYDLLGHTLHTVDSIKKEGLTKDQFKELRIAAFFHDIGKPDVVRMHSKIANQQVFYGHAKKSAEISTKLLKNLGYDEDVIKRITFYIAHHDDFISYKTNDKITPNIAHHEYIRGITPETVSEIMFQNEYEVEFQKYNLNKDQIRYMCYILARNQEPHFSMGDKEIHIDSSMKDTIAFIQKIFSNEKSYKVGQESHNTTIVREYLDRYSLEDYQMLLKLCRADVMAQSEVVEMNGKKISSKKEKIQNINDIESCLVDAKRIFDLSKLSNLFLGNIVQASPTKDIMDRKISQLPLETLLYLETTGGTPWHDHTDVLTWLDLANKPGAFLEDLKKKIEEKKDISITDKVDIDLFNELYELDMKDLVRLTKKRKRKEISHKLEKNLLVEESEERKIKEAEDLLLQINQERREEGR